MVMVLDYIVQCAIVSCPRESKVSLSFQLSPRSNHLIHFALLFTLSVCKFHERKPARTAARRLLTDIFQLLVFFGIFIYST